MAKKTTDGTGTTNTAPAIAAPGAADSSADLKTWTLERLRTGRRECQEKMDEGSRHRTDRIREMDHAIQAFRDAVGEIDAELKRRGET